MTRLVVGGAQETALATCSLADPSKFDHVLVVGAQTGLEGSLFEEATGLGIRVLVVSTLVREVSPVRDAAAVASLIRVLVRERPDIVHTHSSKAGILGRIAARGAGVPEVVHSVHGWSFNDHMPGPVRYVVALAERALAHVTDRFVVENVKDMQRGIAHRIGRPETYVTIRNGIDLKRYPASAAFRESARTSVRAELKIPAEAPVVGTVIRFTTQKNPQSLVRAAAMVLTSQPTCYFIVVGDGPLRSETEAVARDLVIQDRVVFTGVRRDIPWLLAAFDVFALSSRWEGLPRVVLEAMASGVPIVAPRVDGIEEAVQNGISGVLVRPDDPVHLASGILQVISDQHAGIRYRVAARKTVEELFTLRRMTDQLQDLYESLAREDRLEHQQTIEPPAP